MQEKAILNGRETAVALEIDVATLWRQLRNGRLPVQPIPGTKPPRWRRCDVDAVRGA